jgi:hypothetical protein
MCEDVANLKVGGRETIVKLLLKDVIERGRSDDTKKQIM